VLLQLGHVSAQCKRGKGSPSAMYRYGHVLLIHFLGPLEPGAEGTLCFPLSLVVTPTQHTTPPHATRTHTHTHKQYKTPTHTHTYTHTHTNTHRHSHTHRHTQTHRHI